MLCKIPKLAHFVWVGCEMPDWATWLLDKFKEIHRDYDVILHTDHEELEDVYLETYNRVTMPCQKSDLIRASIINKYGGWYFDSDYLMFRSINDIIDDYDLNDQMFLSIQQDKRLANGIIGAPPNHEFWETYKRGVVENWCDGRARYGPNLYTKIHGDSLVDKIVISKSWAEFYSLRNPRSCINFLRGYINGTAGDQFNVMLRRNCGLTPYAMHLWMGGRSKNMLGDK